MISQELKWPRTSAHENIGFHIIINDFNSFDLSLGSLLKTDWLDTVFPIHASSITCLRSSLENTVCQCLNFSIKYIHIVYKTLKVMITKSTLFRTLKDIKLVHFRRSIDNDKVMVQSVS